VSDGGLAICLAEAAIFSGVGAEPTLDDDPVTLFGETGGRAVLACAPERRDEVLQLAGELGVPVHGVGLVGGATLFGLELSRLRHAWEGT
jgi:phosphoribosylformylglycinamidine (FGAM) synthase-like enzyme